MTSTLFTLQQSWHKAPWMYERLAFASKGDTLLLVGDAVLALQSPLSLASMLAKCAAAQIAVCALEPDLVARGISNQYPEVELIDYGQFVSLVERYEKQLAW